MDIEWNVRLIVIYSLVTVLFIATNVGQYFVLWKPKQENLIASYELEIAALEETLFNIGPMVSIWTIRDGVEDLFPGKEIELNDLVQRDLPESLVNRSLVLDPETVAGKYYRVKLTPGSALSMDVVMDDPVDDTTREYDVVSNVMPIGLKVGDYVDYRIVYPLGEDYIVLPHKRVEAIHDKTIKFKLNETEIHFYQAALIDYFLQKSNGGTLYLTKYLEPGIQEPALQYYAVPENILAIMTANPNIIEKISSNLNEVTRNVIDEAAINVSSNIGQSIYSGRNEERAKIDGGTNHQQNEEKERIEAEARDNFGASDNIADEVPVMEIERGVVE